MAKHQLVLPAQSPIDSTVLNRAFFEQAADRALKTAVQNAAVFFTGVSITDVNWKQALAASAVAAFLSFLMSILSSRAAHFESFTVDLVQRAGRTFLATFLASIATVDYMDLGNWKQSVLFALSATLLSLITSGFSKNVGTPGTASLLPGADLVPVAQQAVIAGQQVIAAGQPYVDEALRQAQPHIDAARDQAVSYMNSLRKPSR